MFLKQIKRNALNLRGCPFHKQISEPSSKYETAGLAIKFSNLFIINLFISLLRVY